jgi:hypothetical protein
MSERKPTQPNELRDFLIVLRRALILVDCWWTSYPNEQYPKAHPYRQAAAMICGYIERRYIQS